MRLISGECLAELEKLINEGVIVDAIITDPPYGTTNCSWDRVIDNNKLIPLLKKLLKPNGRLILFGNEPFYSYQLTDLLNSNLFIWSHEIIWDKVATGSPLMAGQQPLRKHEKIMILIQVVLVQKILKQPLIIWYRTI